MGYYGLTAVRVDGLGRISHGVIDQFDPGDGDRPPWWTGSPRELEAHDIAYLIASGNNVEAVFVENGATTFGPRVLRVKYEDGFEGIELAEERVGRTYRDLAQLGD